MLCAFWVLLDYTVLAGPFTFLYLLLGVHSLKLIFQWVEALVQDL
jgi:hypothetical protein